MLAFLHWLGKHMVDVCVELSFSAEVGALILGRNG